MRRTICSAVVLAGWLAGQGIGASLWTVVNTNDAGPGSLRDAIPKANTDLSPGQRIVFDIAPAGGVKAIRPLSALPAITSAIAIDGYAQPGSTTNTLAAGDHALLQIELDGTQLGSEEFDPNPVSSSAGPLRIGSGAPVSASAAGAMDAATPASLTAIFTNTVPLEELAFELWQQSYGGSDEELIAALLPMADGGFLIGGTSYSLTDGNKTAPNQGVGDFWAVRVDAGGGMLWDQSYGGADDDEAMALLPMTADRWVVSGLSASEPGPDKASPAYGSYDAWWVQLDGSGTKLNESSFGGAGLEAARFVPLPDGGAFLAGHSDSGIGGTKTSPNHGSLDFWLVRFDAGGTPLWDASAGGNDREMLANFVPLPDGGALLAGWSFSDISGNKTSPNYGQSDGWLVRFDANGNKLWDRSYGGTGGEFFHDIAAMPDGSFIIVGESYSGVSGNKTSPNHGDDDVWVVRVDADGNKIWDLTFGGSGYDYGSRVAVMPDGGVLITAASASDVSGNKGEPSFASQDVWLLRLDPSGNKLWERVLGGTEDEYAGETALLDDGFITGHVSPSAPSGNKTSPNHGADDFWVLRFATREAPVGMPALFLNGTYTASQQLSASNSAQIELRTSFTNGTIFYTLDGSDPHSAPLVYAGPFVVGNSVVIRAFASSTNFVASPEFPPVALAVLAPPAILVPPSDQTVVEGSSATLSVSATGTAPLFYRWYANGVALANGTNADLTFPSVGQAQAADFRVAVSNSFGAVTSSIATLTVLTLPEITLVSADTNAVNGSGVTLSVRASGSPPLSFQWRKNGVTLPGATSSNLTFSSVHVSDGGSYTVLVVNQAGSVIAGPIQLNVVVPALQPNDDFINRVALTGLLGLVAGTNTGATKEPAEPNHGGQPGGRSVWYRWIAPTNGIARFDTTGSAFDTLLGIYTGNAVSSLTPVAEDEDQGGFLTSAVTFNATNGMEYAIAIDGFAAASGSFVLGWDLQPTTNAAPEIVEPPADRTVLAGATTNFNVVARGRALTYQWYFNSQAIPDATNATLSVTNVQAADVGFYTVQVSSDSTAVMSPAALLEIGPEPALHSRGKIEDLLAAAGGGSAAAPGRDHPFQASSSAFFSPVLGQVAYNIIVTETNVSQCRLTCAGYRIVGTRWLTDFSASANNSPNAPVLVFSVTNNVGGKVLSICRRVATIGSYVDLGCSSGEFRVTNDGDYEYLLAIQSLDDGIVSPNNRLDWVFGLAPTITLTPSKEVVAGTDVSLTAVIDNHVAASLVGTTNHIPDAALQWFFKGQPLAGQTGATLVLSNVQPAGAGEYALVARNLIGDTTNRFTLTVGSPPAFRVADAIQYVRAGGLLHLAVDASPSTLIGTTTNSPPSYQWYYIPPEQDRTNLLALQTNAFLINPTVALSTAGVYRVVASNRFGLSQHNERVVIGTPPILTLSSATQYVAVGASAILSATVTNGPAAGWLGPPPAPVLQWFANGLALDGATDPTLALPSVQLRQDGEYRLEAANAFGSSTALTYVCIGLPPRILSLSPPPGKVVARRNSNLDLQVVAEASLCGLGYQWRLNDLPVGFASVHALRNLSGANAGSYRVSVTNAFGATTSAPIQLVIAQDLNFKPAPALPGATNFCLTWTLVPGANTLQYQASLQDTNWTTLWSSNVTQTGTATICDPVVVNSQRFYRILIGE